MENNILKFSKNLVLVFLFLSAGSIPALSGENPVSKCEMHRTIICIPAEQSAIHECSGDSRVNESCCVHLGIEPVEEQQVGLEEWMFNPLYWNINKFPEVRYEPGKQLKNLMPDPGLYIHGA